MLKIGTVDYKWCEPISEFVFEVLEPGILLYSTLSNRLIAFPSSGV